MTGKQQTTGGGVVSGLPIPAVKLINDSNAGYYIIEFENPRLSNPIYLDKSGFRDANGRLVQYRSPFTNEPEDIVITAPTFRLDLRTEEGKAKADYIRAFDIRKRLGSKVKITDGAKQVDERVTAEEKEYMVRAKITPYLSDPIKLQALALNLGGIEVNGARSNDVKAAIYDRVRSSPQDVLKVIDDEDFEYKTTILVGAAKKVITEKSPGVFYYGQVYLGGNLAQAVKWCRDNPNEYVGIVTELNSMK
jgi:hypothetical protein